MSADFDYPWKLFDPVAAKIEEVRQAALTFATALKTRARLLLSGSEIAHFAVTVPVSVALDGLAFDATHRLRQLMQHSETTRIGRNLRDPWGFTQ